MRAVAPKEKKKLEHVIRMNETKVAKRISGNKQEGIRKVGRPSFI
jgi:hypothetical protein